MVTAITHSMIHWCQMAYLEPMNEGIARITRCVKGVNLHNIDYTELAWSERVVDLLTGVILLVPLLNLVVWVFMKTLGNTEILSKPFIPIRTIEPWEDALHAAVPIITKIEPLAPAVGERPIKITKFKTLDQLRDEPPFEAKWEILTYEKVRIVKRKSDRDSGKLTFDLNWGVQKFAYTTPNAKILIEKINHTTILVTGTKDGLRIDEKLPIENPSLPWIQEPTGFRPFIKSSQEPALHFYAVNPKDFSLAECIVKREEESEDPEFGTVIKLTTKFASGFMGFFELASTLHDPKTGKLLTSSHRLSPFTWGTLKLITDDK